MSGCLLLWGSAGEMLNKLASVHSVLSVRDTVRTTQNTAIACKMHVPSIRVPALKPSTTTQRKKGKHGNKRLKSLRKISDLQDVACIKTEDKGQPSATASLKRKRSLVRLRGAPSDSLTARAREAQLKRPHH